MKQNHNEAKNTTEALQEFSQQFGQDDIYNRIIIEELLKLLLGFKEEEKPNAAANH